MLCLEPLPLSFIVPGDGDGGDDGSLSSLSSFQVVVFFKKIPWHWQCGIYFLFLFYSQMIIYMYRYVMTMSHSIESLSI